MKLLSNFKMLEEVEQNLPYSFESLEEEFEIVERENDPYDFVAIDTTIHIALKDNDQIGHAISLFVNAFTEEVYVFMVEVNGSVEYEVIKNKKEAALLILSWIKENSLILENIVFTEEWDELDTFSYDAITDVANKLALLK